MSVQTLTPGFSFISPKFGLSERSHELVIKESCINEPVASQSTVTVSNEGKLRAPEHLPPFTVPPGGVKNLHTQGAPHEFLTPAEDPKARGRTRLGKDDAVHPRRRSEAPKATKAPSRGHNTHKSDRKESQEVTFGKLIVRRALMMSAALTTICATLTMGVRLSSAVAREVDSLFFSASVRIPPPELRVTQTKLRAIKGHGGTTLYLASGTVLNQTPENFQAVTIETLLYDLDGAVIGRGLARAGNILPPEAVQNLPTDVLFELQRNKSTKAELESGKEATFTLAIEPVAELGLKNVQPSSYSTRVFTVGN